VQTDDYPWGWSHEFVDLYKASLAQAWADGRGLELAVPSASGDPALIEWAARYLRLAASPATARAMLDFASTTDIRDLLADVRSPTLVLHRRHEQWMHPDNGRYVADHIPGARFEELPGEDHWPWLGDAGSVLGAIEPFLDDVREFEGFPKVHQGG
jgi:pimeloyl-ACP methyl ester carboxylesterase